MTQEPEQREWTCSECGDTLTYPDTSVLQHYDEEHGDEYGDMIGQYQTGSGEWRNTRDNPLGYK